MNDPFRRRRADGTRGLWLTHSVATKTEGIVVTPDGRFVCPSVLIHSFKPSHTVRWIVFQVSHDRELSWEEIDQPETEGLSGAEPDAGTES